MIQALCDSANFGFDFFVIEDAWKPCFFISGVVVEFIGNFDVSLKKHLGREAILIKKQGIFGPKLLWGGALEIKKVP